MANDKEKKEGNVFSRMQDEIENRLPDDIEKNLLHQAGTFSVFSRVVELYGPNALDIASRFICGHPDCNPGGPQSALEDDVPFWRIKAVKLAMLILYATAVRKEILVPNELLIINHLYNLPLYAILGRT